MNEVANLYTLSGPIVDEKAPPGQANARWDNHGSHSRLVSRANRRKLSMIVGGTEIGMERTAEGPRKSIGLVRELKSDFACNVKVTEQSDEFVHVAASGFGGVDSEPVLHTEELTFEYVELKQRSH